MGYRQLYMPCIANPEIMYAAVASVEDQVNSIVVINNTMKPMEIRSPKMILFNPPDALLYGQSLNFAVRDSDRRGYPYVLWAHNDILVSPGAIDALFEKYEEVKETKWGVIWTNYDSLCLFNPRFFVDENLWEDCYVFPTYYGDNARAHLMKLRGYSMLVAEKAAPLVNHLGSKTIGNNASFRKKNDIVFKYHGQIYNEMFGGYPGHEKVTDPTIGGIYPLGGNSGN